MTIEQTITIPEDRLLHLELPGDIPLGRAYVQVTINPAPEKQQLPHLTKQMIEKIRQNPSPTLLSLTGIVHTNMTLDEIRAERL
jgi:hypothetical protein